MQTLHFAWRCRFNRMKRACLTFTTNFIRIVLGQICALIAGRGVYESGPLHLFVGGRTQKRGQKKGAGVFYYSHQTQTHDNQVLYSSYSTYRRLSLFAARMALAYRKHTRGNSTTPNAQNPPLSDKDAI